MRSHLCAAEEVSFTAMENDGPQAPGPSFRKLLTEVYKECQTGVTMTESPVVVCGSLWEEAKSVIELWKLSGVQKDVSW